ncbi:protein spaetzle 5 [Amyelois transitella]|uniref:protein spaetzle 5 n=1 Tax=Amyelois transitella TaxID=680683 RepID=UPI00067D695E|nr:protein spaetzle 5 [Amyelois transitella]
MAGNMKRLGLYLRTFLLLIWTLCRGGDGYSCPYGQNCYFEPAPPGRAPSCAQPGLTYCLYPQPYPEQIIRKLIDAGQYDIRTLLSDESRDDFSSNKKNDYPYGYGPNSLPHVDQISLVNDPVFPKNYNKFHNRYNPLDIYDSKTPLQPPSPVDPSPYNINTYQSSNFTKFGFQGYQTSSPNFWNVGRNHFNDYDKKLYRQSGLNPNLGFEQGYNPNMYDYDSSNWFRQAATGVTHYNPNEWWKYVSPSRADVTVQRSITFPTRSSTIRSRKRRNAKLVSESAKRTLTGAEALRIALGLASAETAAERPRRQTANTVDLCRIRTQYITPRAALNNKGNWRYVVNMPDNMTQLVRAEICASTECNGLCTLPAGYSSRCEQKYIQKRLVALESSGQNLYTDLFWIPSCCQCTIVANNNS